MSHIDNALRNRQIILNIIRYGAPISRKQVSDVSHLSIATTKRLIEEMIKDGSIIEAGLNKSARGRSASLLKLNADYCCAFGINIIPHALEISGISFTGDIIYRESAENVPTEKDGVILYTPNMTGWEDVNLGRLIKDGSGLEVIVDNTTRCMALSEKRYGLVGDLRNFLYIYIGEGVGSGIVLDGRIHRGRHDVAG